MDRIGLICRYIKEDPRSTQRDLAQKTGFSVGTVNTLIKEAMQQAHCTGQKCGWYL